MRKIFLGHLFAMISFFFLNVSCTTNDVDMPAAGNNYEIKDEAFGEYLFYLGANGVTRVDPTDSKAATYTYYVDTVLAGFQTGELNLSKSSASITKLKDAGLITAEKKIQSVDGIQFFTSITGLVLTSNELEEIDLTRAVKLETLNMNNNLIGFLDLTHNKLLKTLTYTASSRADADQRLESIDLSQNTLLTSVDLSNHVSGGVPIAEAIYNRLTVAKGVRPAGPIEPGVLYELDDEVFGEYLHYLNVSGIVDSVEVVDGIEEHTYYVDVTLAKYQAGELNLSKSASSIAKLVTAGLRTAENKISDVNGIQCFTNITGLVLTSNEVTEIDLSELVKLETLNLNNNFIGELDLSKNINLTTLSYTASSKADETQKLTMIDLSRNTKLTSVDLSNHTGSPFPIPEAIFNQLTVAKGVIPDTANDAYPIPDAAFGEYLKFLNVPGVTEEEIGGVYSYYIDTELAKTYMGALNLSKSASSITTLTNAGVRTASQKITNVDGLQFFIHATGLTLTSNEIEHIDLSALVDLQTLNLNNNFIGSLDVSKNVDLQLLYYTASTRATATQKLNTIDLSRNSKLQKVNLSGHPGAPFPIPAAIFAQLTEATGVVADNANTLFLIPDEAFGEYLKYLGVDGVTEEVNGGVYSYYIDTEVAKTVTTPFNLSKAGASITTLTNAGVRTASVKILSVDGLQFFTSITSLTLTSNELDQIDLTKLVALESLNLNNNFIGSLDLSKNVELKTLSYTASSKSGVQKLSTIDLSANTKLTSIDLSNHPGAPFPIPAAIFNQLTTKKGVVSQ